MTNLNSGIDPGLPRTTPRNSISCGIKDSSKNIGSIIFAPMSLPMRITFENKDYTYTVLTKIIDKDTTEIKISLEGKEMTLMLNQSKEWDALERTVGDDHGLIKAIAKNIALRFRI